MPKWLLDLLGDIYYVKSIVKMGFPLQFLEKFIDFFPVSIALWLILLVVCSRYGDCYMTIPVTQAKYYVEHNEVSLFLQITLWHSYVARVPEILATSSHASEMIYADIWL